MTTERWCDDCGDYELHRQIRPADVPGETYECLLCPIRSEVEFAAAGGSDR